MARVPSLSRMILALLVVAGSAAGGYALLKVFQAKSRSGTEGQTTGMIAWDAVKNRQWDIYVARPDGTGLLSLTNDRLEEGSPAWSPDGRKVAFQRNRPSPTRVPHGPQQLVVVDVATRRQTVLATVVTGSITDPAWSPDSTQIAFSHWNGSPYIVAANGEGIPRDLLPEYAVASTISWSPDGHQVVFAAYEDGSLNADLEIFVASVDGNPVSQLTHDDHDQSDPRWSPTGEWIVFRDGWSYDHGGLELIRPDGSERHRIASPKAGEPVWSPDGQRLLVDYRSGQSWRTWQWSLAIVGLEGSLTVLRNLEDPRAFDWSAGGERIVYQAGNYCEGGLYVVNPDGTGRTKISWGAGIGASPDWGMPPELPLPGPSTSSNPSPAVGPTTGNSPGSEPDYPAFLCGG